MRELAWAPIMMVTPIGRKARPVFRALSPSTFCRYSERKYHIEKKAAPTRNITMFAPDSDRDRNSPNLISGARASRNSMIANTASSTTAAPSSDSVRVPPHGCVSVPMIA